MPPAVFRVPGIVIQGGVALGDLFPAYIPNCETLVYQRIKECTETHLTFPSDGSGIPLPATFDLQPDLALYDQTAEDGVSPAGRPSQPIPVIQGWPTYPGRVPQIGVALGTDNEDVASKTSFGGFAGDAIALDANGDQIASCAYYADPRYASVVVELIHENRDERDRLHNQLRRILFPLRHILPGATPLVKEVAVNAEKQDLPLDESPLTLYVSLITVEMWSEALIPAEVMGSDGFIEAVAVQVNPLSPSGSPLHVVTPPM